MARAMTGMLMTLWEWLIGAAGVIVFTLYMLLHGWRRVLPAPPLPLSPSDRRVVIWVLIGSLALAVPESYTLIESGDHLGIRAWAGTVMLTQFPLILAVSLIVDVIYKRQKEKGR